MSRLTLAVPILALASSTTVAAELLIRARTVYTVTQGTLEDAEILIADGKIRTVGKSLDVPHDAQVLDVEAVMPGMIDVHTHLALDRSSRPEGPVTAEWRAIDHLRLDDPGLGAALAGGLTTIVTRSGSGVISSGQAVALKPSTQPKILKEFVDLKMAVRPLVKLRPGETPATVMGWYATASEYFRKAQEYLEQGGVRILGWKRLRPFCAAT